MLATPLLAPQLLAFPHHAEVGDNVVYAEQPLDRAALGRVLARADRLVGNSGIARASEPRRIFLTDGGWRWLWLANTTRGSFALTRPVRNSVIIVNRSDLSADRVSNGRAIGGQRTLSGVIAHEKTHGMLSRRYGRIALIGKPQWLVEGYCDFVAGESALSAQQAAALQRAEGEHPALAYYLGRRRVAEALRANGGDVDALFEGTD